VACSFFCSCATTSAPTGTTPTTTGLVLIAIVTASPLAWTWLNDFAYRIDMAWWVFAVASLLPVGIALLTVSFQT